MDSTIQRAHDYFQSGNLAEAEAACKDLLQVNPNHPGALHLLGCIASQIGMHDVAVELIAGSIDLAPHVAEAHLSLGNALSALNQHENAIASYQKAIELKPDYIEAHNNINRILREQNEKAPESKGGQANLLPRTLCFSARNFRSFYSSNHSPYYIYSPDYSQQSAGIRALHYLCHALNESGLEAYIICPKTAPHLRTPLLTEDVLKKHQASGRVPITVYPEIMSGDPLQAGGLVARWLLNQPGHIRGDTIFPTDNLIFAYHSSFLPADMRGEILHIPTCDLSIFNNLNNPNDCKRDLVCYYSKKYAEKGGKLTAHVKGARSLCQDQNLTPPEIATLLRRSKLLYIYEPTALREEALLCGCPVSIIVTEYWRNNTGNYMFPTDFGVIMDDKPESVALAQANVHKYPAIHEENIREAWKQLDHFVEITQQAAQTRSRTS